MAGGDRLVAVIGVLMALTLVVGALKRRRLGARPLIVMALGWIVIFAATASVFASLRR